MSGRGLQALAGAVSAVLGFSAVTAAEHRPRFAAGDDDASAGECGAAESWRSISVDGAPPPSDSHTSVWIGDHVTVWGGTRVLVWGGMNGNE